MVNAVRTASHHRRKCRPPGLLSMLVLLVATSGCALRQELQPLPADWLSADGAAWQEVLEPVDGGYRLASSGRTLQVSDGLPQRKETGLGNIEVRRSTTLARKLGFVSGSTTAVFRMEVVASGTFRYGGDEPVEESYCVKTYQGTSSNLLGELCLDENGSRFTGRWADRPVTIDVEWREAQSLRMKENGHTVWHQYPNGMRLSWQDGVPWIAVFGQQPHHDGVDYYSGDHIELRAGLVPGGRQLQNWLLQVFACKLLIDAAAEPVDGQ